MSNEKAFYNSKQSSEDSRGPGEEKQKTNCPRVSAPQQSFVKPETFWMVWDGC